MVSERKKRRKIQREGLNFHHTWFPLRIKLGVAPEYYHAWLINQSINVGGGGGVKSGSRT